MGLGLLQGRPLKVLSDLKVDLSKRPSLLTQLLEVVGHWVSSQMGTTISKNHFVFLEVGTFLTTFINQCGCLLQLFSIL
jgi:hypothetical protein